MFTILRCLFIALGVIQPVDPQTIIFQYFPYTLTEEEANVRVSTNKNRDEVTPTGQCFYDNNNDIKCVISFYLDRENGNEQDVRHRLYNNLTQSLTSSKITHAIRADKQFSPDVLGAENPAHFAIGYMNEDTELGYFRTYWRIIQFSNGNGISPESPFGNSATADQLNPRFIKFLNDDGSSIAIGCHESNQQINCTGKDFSDNIVIDEFSIDSINGNQSNVDIFMIPGFGIGTVYEAADPVDGNIYIYCSIYQINMINYGVTSIIQGQKLSDEQLLPNGQHFRPVAKYVDNTLIYAYDAGNATEYDVYYEKYKFINNSTLARIQSKTQVNDIPASHDHQASIEIFADLDLIVLCWNTYNGATYAIKCRLSKLHEHQFIGTPYVVHSANQDESSSRVFRIGNDYCYYVTYQEYVNNKRYDVKLSRYCIAIDPTIAPTLTPTVTPTANPSASPSFTPTITPTNNPSVSPSFTPTQHPTTTPTVMPSNNPSASPSFTPTTTPTSNPSVSPSLTPTQHPTTTPTVMPSNNPSASPSFTPTTIPTSNPSFSPSLTPTQHPTTTPTVMPSNNPSASPSFTPTQHSTTTPTVMPSNNPSASPSFTPTTTPTSNPSFSPSFTPTQHPTTTPTVMPSNNPSASPSFTPTTIPTSNPSVSPSLTPTQHPTTTPTVMPSNNPSASPSFTPTTTPTNNPSFSPSLTPTQHPTTMPTVMPSNNPSASPSFTPTITPTNNPSVWPSLTPTQHPTNMPTGSPSDSETSLPTVLTVFPTVMPSRTPTANPSVSPSFTPTIAPTNNPSFSPSLTPTQHPTTTPTVMPSNNPSASPSFTPTTTPTNNPSFSPSLIPTQHPTNMPTGSPSDSETSLPTVLTVFPTVMPSRTPTANPSVSPSFTPTIAPTDNPSVWPSLTPTQHPTTTPTVMPSNNPSASPSFTPTTTPTNNPSVWPSLIPTQHPTNMPTGSPSDSETSLPTVLTVSPTVMPSRTPTANPSVSPSFTPTIAPTNNPSVWPSLTPTQHPTTTPTVIPSSNPSASPSFMPTVAPTNNPSFSPSLTPTQHPTNMPTGNPSMVPTIIPKLSQSPTQFLTLLTLAPTMPIKIVLEPVALYAPDGNYSVDLNTILNNFNNDTWAILNVMLTNGSAFPPWLSFESGMLVATNNTNLAVFNISILARNQAGEIARALMSVSLGPVPSPTLINSGSDTSESTKKKYVKWIIIGVGSCFGLGVTGFAFYKVRAARIYAHNQNAARKILELTQRDGNDSRRQSLESNTNVIVFD